MSETHMTRIGRDHLDPKWQPAWDTLNSLTGSATFVEVFAQAPQASAPPGPPGSPLARSSRWD